MARSSSGTTAGLTLDAELARRRAPIAVRVLEADGWADAGALATDRVVDAGLVRRLQDRTGHEFVWLRLVAA